MAKKTNKTSHVLNLISNRTGLTEEEIAPETAPKKRPADQTRDALKKRVSFNSISDAPQTVEELLAEDIPAAPQGRYQKKETVPEPPAFEESIENRSFSNQEDDLDFNDPLDYEDSDYKEAYPPSLEDEAFSVPSEAVEMNLPSSPKAFADAISAAQQALADTLPPEQQTASTSYHDAGFDSYSNMDSEIDQNAGSAFYQDTDSDSYASEIEQESIQSFQETYDNQAPPASENIPSAPPHTPEYEQAVNPEKPVSEQYNQSASPKKTFADLLPPTPNAAKEPSDFAGMLSQTNSDRLYQSQSAPAPQQPMGQPLHSDRIYQNAPQSQQSYYQNQEALQPAAEYYVQDPNQPQWPQMPQQSQYPQQQIQTRMPQQPVMAQHPLQHQMPGQPAQMQMPGQSMQIPGQPWMQMPADQQIPQQPMQPQIPQRQTAPQQSMQRQMITPTQMQPQMMEYQPAEAPYPTMRAAVEQPPEITPYDGPKTAQPSLINALFGKPGSKKAAPVLLDEETPDPRLFQPFDVSSVILKNIEDYVDSANERETAASTGTATASSEDRSKLMEKETVRPIKRIPFKKGPFQDPSKQCTFLAKNIMEDLVINQMFFIMQKFDMCTCNECVNDILALSLNSLPPKYVVSKQTSLYVKLAACEKQYDADIVSAITQACALVQKNPRHESRD